MVVQVSMRYNSSRDNFYLEPVKADKNNNWNNLNVNLFITVPKSVNPEIQTNVGNFELTDIEGDIKGKLTANEKVEIRDGGKYKGDIVAASILVSEKALFDGNVSMKAEGEEPAVKKFSEKRSPQSKAE